MASFKQPFELVLYRSEYPLAHHYFSAFPYCPWRKGG